MRIAILLVAGMLMACVGGGSDAAPEVGISATNCVYELHDDLTGETTELAAIPNTFYISAHYETGGGVTAAIQDTTNADLDATLIAPPCLRDEALALIEAIQASDKAQAQDGVPFEERIYP